MLGHHVGQNIFERIRLHHKRQSELLVILRHANVFQVFGDAAARNGGVERFGVGQVAAALRGEAAFAGQAAGDLPSAVGTEIEVDDGVVVADRRHGLAAIVHAGKGDDEFVSHVTVVGILHALHRVHEFAAFRFAGDRGVEGL